MVCSVDAPAGPCDTEGHRSKEVPVTIHTERPDLFFMEQLERVLASEHIRISDQARVYLAGVLCRPASHDESLVRELLDALAPRFVHAMNDGDTRELRTVGDQALLLRGFWWQYVERVHSHGVDARYFEDIGQRSYLLVRAAMFDELADQFAILARALALLWSHTALHTQDDLVALYRFWLHTRSPYARVILERHGIRPESGHAPS